MLVRGPRISWLTLLAALELPRSKALFERLGIEDDLGVGTRSDRVARGLGRCQLSRELQAHVR